MQVSLSLKVLSTAGRAGLVCCAFALCVFARDTCDTETFRGAYGFTATGFVLPPLTVGGFGFGGGESAVPIQGIQLITSDGKGNLTDKESLSLGGTPLAATAPNVFSFHYGTYSVDSDCTGIAFLTNAKIVCPSSPDNCPNQSSVTLAFIIDKAGRKVRMVGVPPYDNNNLQRVVSSIGEKLDPEDHGSE